MASTPPITIPLQLSGLELSDEILQLLAERAADIVIERGALPPVTPWLTTEEAADWLRIPLSTFASLPADVRPPAIRDGRRNYYHRDQLDAWRREAADHPVPE